MTKTVSFTYVKFMSVVKIPSGDFSGLLSVLAQAGFIINDDRLASDNLLLLFRHILFSQEDMRKDILLMEKTRVQYFLNKYHPQGEWRDTLIQDKENICILKEKVKYDGRTVCLQVYYDLDAYVD